MNVDLVQLTVWIQAWTTIRTALNASMMIASSLDLPLDQTTCLDKRNLTALELDSDADSELFSWNCADLVDLRQTAFG